MEDSENRARSRARRGGTGGTVGLCKHYPLEPWEFHACELVDLEE